MGDEKKKEILIFREYQITHHSYVDLVEMIRSMPLWFKEKQFDFYEFKRKEKDTGIGYEIESVWMATRDVTDYVKFHFNVHIFARDARKVVLEDGTETYWTRLVVIMKTKMIKNYNKTFKDTNWQEFLRQFYERFVVEAELDVYKNKLVKESLELESNVKSFLR